MELCKMCAEISTVASSVHVLAHEWRQGKVCRGGGVVSGPAQCSAAWSPQGDVYSVAEH